MLAGHIPHLGAQLRMPVTVLCEAQAAGHRCPFMMRFNPLPFQCRSMFLSAHTLHLQKLDQVRVVFSGVLCSSPQLVLRGEFCSSFCGTSARWPALHCRGHCSLLLKLPCCIASQEQL